MCARKLVLAAGLFFCPLACFAAPQIFYTDIISGPNTGGESNKGAYLSLFGKGFGTDLTKVKVTINGVEVGAYKYLGASLGRPDIQQLSVQVGTGTATNTSTGPIVVTVNSETSNNDHTFTVRPGNFYFISHSGSNTTGAQGDFTKPYRTGNYVWNLPNFGAGDFIIVMNDAVYDFGSGQEGLNPDYGHGVWILLTKGGTSETNPITIYGYPGKAPATIRLSSDSQFLVKSSAKGPHAYIALANIKADHNNKRGSSVELGFYSAPSLSRTDYFRLVNYWATNSSPNWGGSSGVTTLSFQVADNLKLYGVQCGPQGVPNDNTHTGHVIYQSHFYTNADSGWLYLHDYPNMRASYQLAGDPWAKPVANSWGANTNVRIHDSLFVNLGQEAILLASGASEILVYSNIINNVSTRNNGAAAISLRGAGLNSGKYYLYNNTVYTDAVPAEWGSGGVFEIGLWPWVSPARLTFYNNIVNVKSAETKYYILGWRDYDFNKIASDHNLWYGSKTKSPPFEGSHALNVNPMFSDAAENNFYLRCGSKAIDRGTDTVLSLMPQDFNGQPRRVGAHIDIGALEYMAKQSRCGLEK